jgi:carboxypeptidase C (cathepsin A)
MRRTLITVVAAVAVLVGPLARGDEKPAAETPKPEAAKKESEPPKPEQSVTQHSLLVGGTTVNYTATAGTLIVRNEKDQPYASVGYIAYIKRDGGDLAKRPITFSYNGGPGSSSVWLHMGVLGPKRIVTSDAAATPPPPYTVVDNAYSILDKTDLVMIDPVGTGISKAVGEAKDKEFWGVDPDIESVSRFIKQYVTENDRWNSPKYLLGESYGTTRSAGVVDYLQTNASMAFNGVILVSVALDLEAIFDLPGNERTFPMFLPTYAAVAWYHKLLPNRPELVPFLDEVRKFALGEYTSALLKGADLRSEPPSPRRSTSTRGCRLTIWRRRTSGSRSASSPRSCCGSTMRRWGGSTPASPAPRSTSWRKRPIMTLKARPSAGPSPRPSSITTTTSSSSGATRTTWSRPTYSAPGTSSTRLRECPSPCPR